MKASTSATTYQVVRKRLTSLKPSPENTQMYRATDPDIEALAASIRQFGLQEPLLVTLDNYIVSGHRRYAALESLGRAWVDCRVLPVRRKAMPKDEYTRLLREHNRQRNKTVAEQVAEEIIDINPEQAYDKLCERRGHSVMTPEHNGFEPLVIEGTKKRHEISDDKAEHMRLILEIVEARRPYWPLSVRAVHYPLLNHDFVRGYYWPHRKDADFGTVRELRYGNDEGSYKATSDLITRLRLNGTIPWKAFDDFTRPLKEFLAFRDARQFIRQETQKLFAGYWRNYMQTQPNHIEVICEKNTVFHMVQQITRKYRIATSSGRGFNSIDPWHDLYQRYKASGKVRLIIIILSDFDPEGEMIPQVGGRTLRDDFGVAGFYLSIIKAGVTREQIQKYNLPPQNFAKETSSNHDWFVGRNGGDDTVYELEALDPADMLRDLDQVIRGVLDVELFNREVAAERQESPYLEAARTRALEALRGLGE
jgi:hypothetical protein